MSNDVADQVRENIRAYLQHVAEVEVGTVLSPASRAIVGFCAEWVRNRLDEKWLAEKVVPFAGAVEPQAGPAPLTESALVGVLTTASKFRQEAEGTVAALRADLAEERKYRDTAEVLLEGVRREAKLWEDYAEELEDSHKSMQRIHALVAMSTKVDPACIYAVCKRDGKCIYPGEGKCSLIERAPVPTPDAGGDRG